MLTKKNNTLPQNNSGKVTSIAVSPALEKVTEEDWELEQQEYIRKDEALCKIAQNTIAAMDEMMCRMLQEEDTKVFSPVCLYEALIVLADMCKGSSKDQILKALQIKEEDMEKVFHNLLDCILTNQISGVCTFSNSVWLNEGNRYHEKVFTYMKEHYGLSSYSGEMGTKEMNQAITDWVNERTYGLLEKDLDIKTDGATIMELLSTIYFSIRWDHKFYDTVMDTFYQEDESKVKCQFMKKTENMMVHAGEKFEGVTIPMENGFSVLCLLPKKGHQVSELLSDHTCRQLLENGETEDSVKYRVNLKLPKFNVGKEFDLIKKLGKMGVTDIFNYHTADLSKVVEEAAYFDKATQTTRVKLNNDGVEAASFVRFTARALGIMMPERREEIDITFDRPFLFVIQSRGQIPVFAGIVKEKEELATERIQK